MATKRISELPAKGSAIGATDLVEISEPNGLGGYVSKRVTGAQLGSDTNFANTDLTLTADRTHDFDGFDMRFTDAHLLVYGSYSQTIYANNSGIGNGVVGVANTGVAVNGSSTSGNGVSGSSTNGLGVNGISVNSKGGAFRNQVLIEEYSTANEVQEASSLFEVKSTVKGALLPRMTTTQKNAISTPATGLIVFDTTLNRYEFYNGSAWVAYYTDPEGWTTIVKSANQDVTNNATPQDDTQLQFAVVAGAFYTVKMDINISANNLTGDYAGRFFVSAGTMKGNGVVTSLSSTGTASVQLQNANSVANTAIFQTGATIADIDHVIPCTIIYSFTPSSNATFSFQFSNAVAAAGRTSRTWKGSILKYKRID